MARIAAVTILYNPGAEVPENIFTYRDKVEKLYVFDNSEIPDSGVTKALQEISKLYYQANGINEGIAVQLNRAARMAMNDGFDLLLTMDQDSYFGKSELESYFQCAESFPGKASVSMFGVNIEKKQSTKPCDYFESVDLITSGSLVNLELWEKIGGFDEHLFIDEVDLEYCYHSVSNGFKTIQFTGIHMEHTIGSTQSFRSIKNLTTTTRSLHSPIRIYYMVRNYFYVNRKYPAGFKENKQRRRKALINRLKNNILYSNSRIKVLSMAFRGYFDYLSGKKGKF